jgi:hypothetical protein
MERDPDKVMFLFLIGLQLFDGHHPLNDSLEMDAGQSISVLQELSA